MKKIIVGFKEVLPAYAFLPLLVMTLLLALSGCVTENMLPSDWPDSPTPSDTSPFKEVYDAGLTKYVGKSFVRPTSVTRVELSPPIDIYHFSKSDTERGPLCMDGSGFTVEASDGSSDQLLFFLDPGGVCLSEICIATPSQILSLVTLKLANSVGIGGILNRSISKNPMAHFNVVHIPYCDGSIFTGDADRPLAYDMLSSKPKMAYQRGLQNLTAAFEVAKQRYPNPSRIVLTGSSGGAYGIVAGLALARYYYPTTEILVIADSGAPMLRDNDKDFLRRALVDINAFQYIPFNSCPDCIANGHLTKLITWALEQDNNFRLASMSHTDDFVIGDIYMKSPPPIFRNALLRETAFLTSSSSRVHRFITLGRGHTYLLDVGAMDVLMNIVGGIATGAADFPKDIDRATLKNMLQGTLTQKVVDQDGKEVTGYEWISEFLNSPNTLQDVVDIQ